MVTFVRSRQACLIQRGMSALGQKQTLQCTSACPLYPQKRTCAAPCVLPVVSVPWMRPLWLLSSDRSRIGARLRRQPQFCRQRHLQTCRLFPDINLARIAR